MLKLDLTVSPDPCEKGYEEAWYNVEDDKKWVALGEDLFLPERVQLEGDRTYWVRSKIHINSIPSELFLIVDDRIYSEVYLNGEKLTGAEEVVLWDKENIRFKMDQCIKTGDNTLVVRVQFPNWWPEKGLTRAGIDPIVLSGAFAAKKEGGIWRINPEARKIRTGSWHEQGYPNYAGTAVYEQVVDLPSVEGKVFLKVEEVRDVLEIWVNGKQAATRPWPPFMADITDCVHEGSNRIELKVTNTMVNLFGRPKPSGLLGSCRIIIMRS